MPISSSCRHSFFIGPLLAACMTAFASGCADVDDDDETEAPEPEGVDTDVLHDQPSISTEQSIDKGLRRDWCCAEKKGSTVTGCYDMDDLLRITAWNRCHYGDNVLREGGCAQYASCARYAPYL